MADNVIRKACDRCHTQKLCCKRVGDQPCERCTRLKTECKSSPSLRYKRQQQKQLLQAPQPQQQHQQQQGQQHTSASYTLHDQQQQQHQHQPQDLPPPQHQQSPHLPQQQLQHRHQHQQELNQYQQQQNQPSNAKTVEIRSRSPKRRRTDSDPRLVLPDTGVVPLVSEAEGLAGISHATVTPDAVGDISDFNFSFDQLAFFTPGGATVQPDALSLPVVPTRVEDFHTGSSGVFAGTWDSHHHHHHHQQHHHHQLLPSSSETFTGGITPSSVFQHSGLPSASSPILPSSLRKRSGAPHNHIAGQDKRTKSRHRHRSRQITLRQTVLRQAINSSSTEDIASNYMAQLSELSGRILELSSGLPQAQELSQDGAPLGRPTHETYHAEGFPIDQMFQITREVADILDQLSAMTVGEDAAKARHARQEAASPANSMLVISIYVRLLDMYQKVFDLVQAELSQTNSDASFRFWKLPDVTVGSFAVESSPSLQMSLTIQLAEDFLTRLSNATVAMKSCWQNSDVQSSLSTNGSSVLTDAVDSSYQAVKSREQSLGSYLVELRGEIEALLDT